MYEVNNGVAQINGQKGKYDGYVTNPSEKYGKNAVENMYTYYEKPLSADNFATPPLPNFDVTPEAIDKNAEQMQAYIEENQKYLDALPPLEFEYRYMPNIQKGQIDKTALRAASKEEMGGVDELSIEELDHRFAPDSSYTSAALDINQDGKVNVDEYSTSFLAGDILSKETPSIDNVDGTINKKGSDAVLAYAKKSNQAAAAALYGNIYKTYFN